MSVLRFDFWFWIKQLLKLNDKLLMSDIIYLYEEFRVINWDNFIQDSFPGVAQLYNLIGIMLNNDVLRKDVVDSLIFISLV